MMFLVPWEKRNGVYFLMDGDEIVYVGSSTKTHARKLAHVRNGIKFTSVMFIPVYSGRKAMLNLERELIFSTQAKHNTYYIESYEAMRYRIRMYNRQWRRNDNAKKRLLAAKNGA